MRIRLIVGWVILLSLVAAIGYAQQPAPSQPAAPAPASSASVATPQTPARTLALAEALDIARRNSPDYRAVLNDRWGASMQNTSSLFSLFTPSASIQGSHYESAAGQQPIPGQGNVQTPSLTSNSWGLNFNYSLSGRTISNRGLSGAQLRATDQDIAGALTLLETGVRTEYLNTLQAQAQADLARRALERVTENLNLAQARYSVGQGTLIDVRRAEVDKLTAEVTLLRADQATQNQILRMFQRLGVPAPEPLAVQLTDSFPVTEATWSQEQLLNLALAQNPGLLSLRAREESARWGVKSAKSSFLPSLNFNAGYSRYRQVRDTTTTSGFNPWNFSVSISLPLFEGLQRNVSVQQAKAQQDDVAQSIHSRELAVRSDVVAAYHAVQAAYRAIDLQRTSKSASGEALELATQRYRVGSGTYLELLDARQAADRSDADYVSAVYDYHKAIATLENAVGRPLR